MKKTLILATLAFAMATTVNVKKIDARPRFYQIMPKFENADSLYDAKFKQLDSLSEAFATQIADYRSRAGIALLPDSAIASAIWKIEQNIIAEFDSLKKEAGFSEPRDLTQMAELDLALENIYKRALIWGVKLPGPEVALDTGYGAPKGGAAGTKTDTLLQFSNLISSTSALIDSLTYADWKIFSNDGKCRWSDAEDLVSTIAQTAGGLDSSDENGLKLKFNADSLEQKYYGKVLAMKKEDAVLALIEKLDSLISAINAGTGYDTANVKLGKFANEAANLSKDGPDLRLDAKIAEANAAFEKFKKDAFSRKHE